jgi:hypothetical protein
MSRGRCAAVASSVLRSTSYNAAAVASSVLLHTTPVLPIPAHPARVEVWPLRRPSFIPSFHLLVLLHYRPPPPARCP